MITWRAKFKCDSCPRTSTGTIGINDESRPTIIKPPNNWQSWEDFKTGIAQIIIRCPNHRLRDTQRYPPTRDGIKHMTLETFPTIRDCKVVDWVAAGVFGIRIRVKWYSWPIAWLIARRLAREVAYYKPPGTTLGWVRWR